MAVVLEIRVEIALHPSAARPILLPMVVIPEAKEETVTAMQQAVQGEDILVLQDIQDILEVLEDEDTENAALLVGECTSPLEAVAVAPEALVTVTQVRTENHIIEVDLMDGGFATTLQVVKPNPKAVVLVDMAPIATKLAVSVIMATLNQQQAANHMVVAAAAAPKDIQNQITHIALAVLVPQVPFGLPMKLWN